MIDNRIPVRETQCATCPWREGSPYAHLREDLERSALSEASRICHSTGSNNAINARTGLPERICRGSRDVQLRVLHGIGFLEAPTDAAWEKKWSEIKERKHHAKEHHRGRADR
jgi:hypothetical protein